MSTTYSKCPCKHPSCRKYTLSTQCSVGFELEHARLYASAEDLAEAVKDLRQKLLSMAHDQFDGVWSSKKFADLTLLADSALAKAGLEPRTYRGWRIHAEHDQWVATSPDYAGSYEGPEDGWSQEGDMVIGKTLAEIHASIDALLGEDE